MTLCIDCDNMDAASKVKWAKANAQAYAANMELGEDGLEQNAMPEFDHWKPHCMANPRQPVTDPVAGTHLDGPPYLRCMDVRKIYPNECPFFKQRKET